MSPTPSNPDPRIVNAVTDADGVKTSRKDLEHLRDKLMKLKKPDLIALLGKPAAKPPKIYAMPVAEMRVLMLPGIRDAAADRPDRDFGRQHHPTDHRSGSLAATRPSKPPTAQK